MKMRIPPVSTLLGVAAMLFGAWWIWGALIQPLVMFFTEEKNLPSYFFLLVMVPLLTLPGVLFAYYGYCLATGKRRETPQELVPILRVFAVIVVFSVSALLKSISPVKVHEEIESNLFTFLAMTLVVPLYLWIKGWLMKQAGVEVKGLRSAVGKNLILLVSLQIWMLGFDLFAAYAPIEEGYTHVKEFPWEILSLIVPIGLAVMFYKMSVRAIEENARAKPHQTEQT